MGITAELMSFCSSLRFEDLAPDVVDRAKYFLLDYLGVAARGSQEDSCQVMYRALRDMHPGDEGTAVIGQKGKLPPHLAALANGTSGHSIELDDVNNSASLHPAVAVFPTALAIAQQEGSGPEEFIVASVIGYEVAIRLGMALDPPRHYEHGFHPTATCGTLGAAATAARLMGLDAEDAASALGIAGSQAAGSMEYLSNGAWTKRMHPGWAAHSGITAACLARNGYLGPSTIIEGKSGFLHSYSDHSVPDKVLQDLGRVYHITRTSIKPHACCRYNQSGIDALLRIVKENHLTPQKIRKIRAGILSGGWDIVAHPPEQKRNPRSTVDAQFSMPYSAAVAVARGRAFIDEYRPELLTDPVIKGLMTKVECFRDPELDKDYPAHWPARVEVETVDGASYSVKIDFPKGDPENALTWEEIIEKFDLLASATFDEGVRKGMVECVRDLEKRPMGLLYQFLETG
jgi:2-methylcitrate dehydratase PrpD